MNNLCDCYKKLSVLGIPLTKEEETVVYGEHENELPKGRAFPVPTFIRINEKCKEYPIVGETNLPITFELMSQIISGVSDFEVNVLSFWILDMFIEGLRTSQNVGMSHEHQKATLLWIAYFFNYVIKQNPTRKQLFRHLKEILFLPESRPEVENSNMTLKHFEGEPSEIFNETKKDGAEENESWSRIWMKKEVWALPLPPLLENYPEYEDDILSKQSQNDSFLDNLSTTDSTGTHLYAESNSGENASHFNVILEILYRIFGRLWIYLEIQSAFHNMPTCETVDLPYKLNKPKPLAPQKFESAISVKSSKKTATAEKSPKDIEAERQLHKYDYILPLQESDQAKDLALQLFGPPPADKKNKGDKNKKN